MISFSPKAIIIYEEINTTHISKLNGTSLFWSAYFFLIANLDVFFCVCPSRLTGFFFLLSLFLFVLTGIGEIEKQKCTKITVAWFRWTTIQEKKKKESLYMIWLKINECKHSEGVKRSTEWTNNELGSFSPGSNVQSQHRQGLIHNQMPRRKRKVTSPRLFWSPVPPPLRRRLHVPKHRLEAFVHERRMLKKKRASKEL